MWPTTEIERQTKKSKAFELIRTMLMGPNGVGMKDTAEAYSYRIWLTTWIVDQTRAASDKKAFDGLAMPVFVTGSPYTLDVVSFYHLTK